MKEIKFKNIIADIRFWIILFFLIRLIGITNAPLEIGHNWRQSLTNMIARNYFENGFNFLYPMIDMAGEKTGIIGSEFPFFNYLIYLFSSIFGDSYWYGRLINLIISSFGLFYFYKLIANLLTKQIAFNATIVLTVSIWFAFSRKSMPDTFSVALVIIGLYFAYDYLKNNHKFSLFKFLVFTSLGMLCKIPALSLFSILIIILVIKSIPIKRKIILVLTATLSFSTVVIWYFYWVPYLLKTYQYQLYFPKGIMEGINEILPLMSFAMEKFYFSSLNSYLAFICFLLGLFFIIKSSDKILKIGLSVITFVFIVFIIKTGAVFPMHNYYIIPFAPIMALVVGYFLAKIPSKYQYILLFMICIEAIANQNHDFFVKKTETYKLTLDSITKKTVPKKDLIIINGGQSPQQIYFAHRKGWTIDEIQLYRPNFIDSLMNLGAKYLIIDNTNFNHKYDYPVKYKDEHYFVYQLKK